MNQDTMLAGVGSDTGVLQGRARRHGQVGNPARPARPAHGLQVAREAFKVQPPPQAAAAADLPPALPAPLAAPAPLAVDKRLPPALACDRVLECMASAYATESQARQVVQQLQQAHGLMPAQSVVLHPAQASWLSFKRHARAWSGGLHAQDQCWQADWRLMALLGALVAGLGGMAWLLLDEYLSGAQSVMMLLLSPLAGAVVGGLCAGLTPDRPQVRHFNRSVRRELAAGRSVVLAHGVPWPQQALVAGLMREQGVGWCSVSAPWRPL